jgi:hypothetical protein
MTLILLIVNVFETLSVIPNLHTYFINMNQDCNTMNLFFNILNFIFCTKNKHHYLCPKSFQIRDDPNETACLHAEIRVKKNDD